MLNLSIAMLRTILLLMLLVQAPAVSIVSPQTGAILRGQVEIIGSMDVPNFSSAELAFGYILPAESWFSIQTFPQPKTESPLAVWDTTSITDGDYNLRLRVFLLDGSFQDITVTGLKIRNDTPEPTATSAESIQPTAVQDIPTPMAVIPTDNFPKSTPLPANPAALTAPRVYSTFGRGALIALGLVILFSLILRLRKDQLQ